jgi:glycosyltransferase involved in cell wall biosynthesis
MVVRDAAEPLAQTLQSVRPVADEIVILDTGSSDNTRGVAEQFEATLQTRPWDDHFSTPRNECWSHVHGQWVLWLDAGETLSTEDAAALKEFVTKKANPATAYMLLVTTPRGEHDISGEQVGRIRLVPNHPDLEFAGRVRETLTASLAECGLVIEGLPYRIRRGESEHDENRRRARAERNLHLATLEMNETGPQGRLTNCLAEAHQTLGDYRRAEELYRKSLIPGSPTAVKLEAFYGLLVALESRGDNRAAQIALCLEALEEFPLDAHLLCAMGGYLQSQGYGDLAVRALETAWRHGQLHPEVWHLADIRAIAAVSLSRCHEAAGRGRQAMQIIDEALRELPDCDLLVHRRNELRGRAKPNLQPHMAPAVRRSAS